MLSESDRDARSCWYRTSEPFRFIHEPPTVDDTFDACELIALESYSPGRTAPNVCAQDVAVNLGDGVWCGWNGESPERCPKHRDRWKVSAHLITARSVDGITDDRSEERRV